MEERQKEQRIDEPRTGSHPVLSRQAAFGYGVRVSLSHGYRCFREEESYPVRPVRPYDPTIPPPPGDRLSRSLQGKGLFLLQNIFYNIK